ncbi:MAG: YdcF family protein [Roseiflexus sp.]|nr:YdcF family protein [Roseiflexus sp.]MCS7289414.1 YdcF family protein [Roseiflexus sp.]MDW8144880.1 YdcF family protein [Roseiflexaceae bacterium]MDW8233766.1 YdcF family protein [Roseiflexaceae bacterium]
MIRRPYPKGMTGALVSLGRGIAAVLTSAFLLLGLTAAMVVVQSGRDEVRPAGAAVVLGEAVDGALTLEQKAPYDHAANLYRRGMVSRIILTGATVAPLGRQYLIDQGLPPQALFIEAESVSLVEGARAAASIARAQGISSVVIVVEPPAMLTALKVARDEGLTAYGSPPGNARSIIDPVTVARETWRYLRYVFAGI